MARSRVLVGFATGMAVMTLFAYSYIVENRSRHVPVAVPRIQPGQGSPLYELPEGGVGGAREAAAGPGKPAEVGGVRGSGPLPVPPPPPLPPAPQGSNATAVGGGGRGVSLSIQEKVAVLRNDDVGVAAPPPLGGGSLGGLALQGLGAVAGDGGVRLSVQDKVSALRRESGEALKNAAREQVRARSFEALSRADVPWAGQVVKASVLGYAEDSPEGCNPMGLSCECLAKWYGRDVCAELPHRQKAEVRMTFHDKAWWQPNAVDVGWHDCPTTRCQLAKGATHAPDSHAFIGPLRPGRFFPTIFFPPKVDEAVNRNVMVNFEGSTKYKVLTDHAFYVDNKIDIYGSHSGEPVPTTLTGPGLLSFLNMADLDQPPQSFRVHGPPFAQRNDSLALFVSHCKGTRARSALLELFAKVSSMISFGVCKPAAAVYAINQVAMHYPMCAEAGKVGKMAEKECVLRHSKFALAIENTEEDFYVTEKLYQALAMGAVPIYWGAPNIRDLLPHPDAAILVRDFQSPAQCMDYVRKVAADEALWKKHTAWKDEDFAPGFNRVLKYQRGNMFCTICEHLGDKIAPAEPQLKGALSECAFHALSKVAAAMPVPSVDSYASMGMDATMLVGSGGGVQVVLGLPPAKVPGPEAAASAEEVDCAVGQVRADVLGDEGLGGEERLGALFRLAVALFRVVDDGRHNTLVVGSPGQEAAWGVGKDAAGVRAEWLELMRHVPADYDVVILSPRGSDGAAGVQLVTDKPHLAGEWLVSRKGAQALLRVTGSEPLKVYRAGGAVGKA